jgi:hypothetical protein
LVTLYWLVHYHLVSEVRALASRFPASQRPTMQTVYLMQYRPSSKGE